MADWRNELLGVIDAPASPKNLQFLSNWQRWEGGHTNNNARFNWLNTTMNAPGAVFSINNVGVKSFDSQQAGINALAATLMNGRYDDIVRALRQGNPYASDISAGLQVWVSGSPTGNPGYAQKVLGGTGAPKAALPQGGRGPKGNLGLAPAPPGDVWEEVFKDDPKFLRTLGMFGSQNDEGRRSSYTTGKNLPLPSAWKGTHVTDNLGWGTKSAIDIMGKPGTPLGAPENGTIFSHGSAQGGESMYFHSDSGYEYWIGHIDNMLPEGTRVKKGQVFAAISADHPRPHAHLDRRPIR